MSYIVCYANSRWGVFVRIQDGTEPCGVYDSEEEARQKWAQAEQVLNWRRPEWFESNFPDIYESDAPGPDVPRITGGDNVLRSSKYSVVETMDNKWAVMCGTDIVSVHLTTKAAQKRYLKLCKDAGERPSKMDISKDVWDLL